MMTFNNFIITCGLHGYVYISEIGLDKIIEDSQNVCGCSILNEMQIELASLIICLINNNVTKITSTSSPKVKKKYYI